MMARILLLALALPAGCVDVASAEIPAEAGQWQRSVTQAVQNNHGLDGPVALHGALIHQESRWDTGAKSPVGAEGLAQFMPLTASDIPRISGMDSFDPLDPGQAIRGMAAYTAWIYDRPAVEKGVTRCDRWSFTLSSYNGGLGWLMKDQKRAGEPGRWDSVEDVRTRSKSAQIENREYVALITERFQQMYLRAGWRGPGVCR